MSSATKEIIEAALRLDPDDREQIAHALWDSLDRGGDEASVEGRFVSRATMQSGQDVLNGATWHGESAAELFEIIRSGRDQDDPGEVPHLGFGCWTRTPSSMR